MNKVLNGRPDTIMKEQKWKLTAKPLPDAKRNKYDQSPMEPTMEFVFAYNQWAMKVYTNSEGDQKNRGVIEANLDGPVMNVIFQALKLAADSVLKAVFDPSVNGDYGLKGLHSANKGYFYQGGKRSEKPGVKSEVIVGIDDDGIFVSARSKGRPEINFYIQPSDFHVIQAKTVKGGHSQDIVTNAIYTKAFAEAMIYKLALIDHDHFLTYPEIKKAKEEAKARMNNGNGFSANNNRSGGSSNYNQQSSGGNYGQTAKLEFDDDIAF